jgi:hypothetical protein
MGTAYGNSFDPLSLSPALWLSDTGSDPAVWEDLSGNGRNATQATASAQPAIVSNALNGRQVRRFDGVNDTMTFARFDLSAFTVFVVAQRSSGGGTYQTIFQVLQASTTRTAVEIGINNDNAYGPLVVGSDGNSTAYGRGGSLAENSSRIISAIWSGGSTNGASNYSLWTNGVATPLTNSGPVGAASGSISRIGSTASGGRIVSYLRGDISEILIFPTALSTSDRKSVENYLAKKWGLGFNPLSLGPALWLDASDSNTLYDATTGGSLVGAGGAVARWEDKSGNARHATQATLANRPLRTLGVQGGKDVLAFDGSNDFLATPAFGGTQDCTYFLVTASKNSTQYKIFAAHANNYENPPLGANYVAVNAARLETAQNGASGTTKLTSKLAASQNLQNNVFRIVEVELTSTNAGHIQRVNGTAHATTNSFSQDPGVFTKLAQSFGVGAYNTGNLPCNCDIAEIIYFTKLLTANDRREVQRYLAQKWNIIP